MKKFINNHMYMIRTIGYLKQYLVFCILYMKKKIKQFLKKDKLILPTVLQLPITNRCNFDCVMCNIHGSKYNTIEIEKFNSSVVNSPLLKNIRSVGLNGGEPFLENKLLEYIELIVKLPSIKNLFIISNGFFTEKIIDQCVQIKKICDINDVLFTITFSLDGVEDIHNKVRNNNNSFKNLMNTVNTITKDKNKYCTNLNFICTISKYNVENLMELDYFAKKNKFSINYNIATDHLRLKNQLKFNDYSILTDQRAVLLAAEFFYKKFRELKSEKYFLLHYYLISKENYRGARCNYLHSAITITPEGEICYCATRSKPIGNIYEDDLYQKYFSNSEYNSEISTKFCNHCSHYIEESNMDGFLKYVKANLNYRKKGW